MEKAKIERFDRRTGSVVSSEMHLAQPGATTTATPGVADGDEDQPTTVLYWARLKGHVPQVPKSGFRGEIHRGPHVDVVRTQGLDVVRAANGEPVLVDGEPQQRTVRWSLDKVLTEAEYDAAVKRAYAPLKEGGAVAVGEDLVGAAARMAGAEKRAADAAERERARAEKAVARAIATPPVLAAGPDDGVASGDGGPQGKPVTAPKDVASPPIAKKEP